MRKPRNVWHLILGISGISFLSWFITSFPPTKFLYLTIFFPTFFLSSLFLSFYVFKHTRRSFFLSSGLTVFLILRALDLHSPLYLILLIASLISLEVSLRKR